jgi:hypothetical protein
MRHKAKLNVYIYSFVCSNLSQPNLIGQKTLVYFKYVRALTLQLNIFIARVKFLP